ncbi:MAG: leucine-rich repeat domain-containing protein [Ruminococcus sp.]|nr:leucine-rich repeat domain-containing protein [Ruminococcus sp.]
MITLYISPNKELTLINHAKVYTGENNIGRINVVVPEKICERNKTDLSFILYINSGAGCFKYSLDFGKMSYAQIPITTDITSSQGDREMYIEILADGEVLGKTNTATMKVYPSLYLNEEVKSRIEIEKEFEELLEIIARNKEDFDSIKEAIKNKFIEISGDTPTSQYGELIDKIGSDAEFRRLIERQEINTLHVPEGTTVIGEYAFYRSTFSYIYIPESVTDLSGTQVFGYSKLKSITIPDNVSRISGSSLFYHCDELTSVVVPDSVDSIQSGLCNYCTNLKSVVLPGNCEMGGGAFSNCRNLEFVTLGNDFNSSVDLSASTLYSTETIVSWLKALKDRTKFSANTLTIGSTNLAKLTDEQKAIAINKNWNLA